MRTQPRRVRHSVLSLIAVLSVGCQWVSNENWVVLLHNAQGAPLRCWMLKGTSVHHQNDNAYWVDPKNGGVITVSGYGVTSIQVRDNDWKDALSTMGYTIKNCKDIQQDKEEAVNEDLPR